jgi:hypothetical protein
MVAGSRNYCGKLKLSRNFKVSLSKSLKLHSVTILGNASEVTSILIFRFVQFLFPSVSAKGRHRILQILLQSEAKEHSGKGRFAFQAGSDVIMYEQNDRTNVNR